MRSSFEDLVCVDASPSDSITDDEVGFIDLEFPMTPVDAGRLNPFITVKLLREEEEFELLLLLSSIFDEKIPNDRESEELTS